ncbi:MAG: PqqD family protein [Candidatus Schekmanbacteria bacterium]|nr:PqqD family protein [Candidatus Schekmanbacteria bacterium]
MLYDTKLEMIHIINDTASIVWQHCDGVTEIEDVVKKLSSVFDLNEDNNVKKDIEDILEDFNKLNLLSN